MKTSHESGAIAPALVALIVIVLVGVVASVAITVLNQDGSPTNSSQVSERANYEDGEYSAIGSYISPGGREEIELTVTIENNVIVATSARADGAAPDSQIYINQFIGGYEAEVVGKNVDEVQLSRVAGSSLTSNGFNDALDQIKDDARV